MRALRLVGLLLVFGVVAEGADAQIFGGSLGVTSSGVEWLYPPPPPSDYPAVTGASSNTDRRSVTVAGSVRTELTSWFSAQSGLRVVPKGFEVTGPTFHMIYAEVPLVGILHTGRGAGLFLEGGVLLGVRAYCRRFFDTAQGRHEDDCGRVVREERRDLRSIRRSDLSWNLGAGVRLGSPEEGWFGLVARLQRSLVDIDPGDPGSKMVNRVFSVSLFLERPPSGLK